MARVQTPWCRLVCVSDEFAKPRRSVAQCVPCLRVFFPSQHPASGQCLCASPNPVSTIAGCSSAGKSGVVRLTGLELNASLPLISKRRRQRVTRLVCVSFLRAFICVSVVVSWRLNALFSPTQAGTRCQALSEAR